MRIRYDENLPATAGLRFATWSLRHTLLLLLGVARRVQHLHLHDDHPHQPVYEFPAVEFNIECLNDVLNYVYTQIFGPEYSVTHLLGLLAAILILSNVLSNLFRYLGAMTVEVMRTRTLQRMRNEMFERTMGMNVGYFSDQRKGDLMSKITSDVMIVQFCITNTLQVAFREPFLIFGYVALMVGISWQLTVFSILYLPVVGLLIGSIVKRLRHPA